jgi:hypothetical protein
MLEGKGDKRNTGLIDGVSEHEKMPGRDVDQKCIYT